MIEYRAREKKKNVRNLLSDDGGGDDDGDGDGDGDDDDDDAYYPHWNPTLSLDFVDMTMPFPSGSVPPQLSSKLVFSSDAPGSSYYPLLHFNDFWTLSSSLVPINATISELPISIEVSTVPFWKWQGMTSLSEHWKRQSSMGSGSSRESDVFVEMVSSTNPVLLCVTFVVSVLHSIFDVLAFKNDISFYRGKKSMEGLSVKTMVVNLAFQVVIFLYLLDNDTSYMVLMSSGVGLLIEGWKVTKAFKVSFVSGVSARAVDSYEKTRTSEYDKVAVSHLMHLSGPLVLGYAIYSLREMKFKSWYSWVISSLVGFIYMFGFVMMTPQLYINYKLKSVAHLNWNTMTYKFLNTFVDDLFAFVIKMPVMHRLACFRDDVIFFIFLYQRRVYVVDYGRVNEFGQGGNVEGGTGTDLRIVTDRNVEKVRRSKNDRETVSRKNSNTVNM